MEIKNLTIGQRVKILREMKSISQEKLGELINVSPKSISAWETGEREITLPNVKALADLFKIPEPFILYGLEEDKLDLCTAQEIRMYMEKSKKINNANRVFAKCKAKMEKDSIEFKKEYLPSFDVEKNTFINGGIFKLDKLPLKKVRERYSGNENLEVDETSIDNDSCYEYDLNGLATYGLSDYLNKNYSSDVVLTDMINSDDYALFEVALNNVLNNKNKKTNYGWNSYKFEYDEEYKKEQLDQTLENLNPHLKNYWKYIILLIDNGAAYIKRIVHGSDYVQYTDEPDTSKTNLAYRLALEFTNKI